MKKTLSDKVSMAKKRFVAPAVNGALGISLEVAYAAAIILAGLIISAFCFVLR